MLRLLSILLTTLILTASAETAAAQSEPAHEPTNEVVVIVPAYHDAWATAPAPAAPSRTSRDALLLPSDLERLSRDRRRARILWGLSGAGGAVLFGGMFGMALNLFVPSTSREAWERSMRTFGTMAAVGGITFYGWNLAVAGISLSQARWLQRQGCAGARRWRGAIAVSMAILPGQWTLFAALPAARQFRHNERTLAACRAAKVDHPRWGRAPTR
jgi:hypothetical protein